MKYTPWPYLAATALSAVVANAAVDFKNDVVPILQQKCVGCHGPDKQKGKLRLDSKEATLKGGKNGPALKPGDADASEIIKRVILPKDNDDHMPPEGEPLAQKEIDTLKAWIAAGAEWPDNFVIEPPKKEAAAATPAPEWKPKPSGPPPPPLPELPKDFKAGAGEAAAIAAIAKSGIEVRPLAQNSPWHEANFRLAGTNVTDATIAPLKDITSLVELNLATTKVTDAGLAAIAGLPYVENLQLQLTGITDAGLAHVKGLANLVTLNLYGTAVTDAGMSQLTGLKHLRSLYLWQSKVTPDGVKVLTNSLPGLYVNTGWENMVGTNTVTAKAEEKKADEKK